MAVTYSRLQASNGRPAPNKRVTILFGLNVLGLNSLKYTIHTGIVC